jgi:pyruvate/2-oxoglutarate dehydrogenase complex dihydrolipoamide acyltransferase (E2) component
MSLFNIPRCQHLKVNGVQCGSPALKRNRFCFFHKRFQEERIKLNTDRLKTDRARHGHASLFLPVLEDANSIQVSLMQIMRLLASGQIDSKIASLLLYALQTATLNLRRLTIEPIHVKDIVIDRRTIDQTCIGGDQWCEEDFQTPEDLEEEEAAAAAQAAAQAASLAKEKARRTAAIEAEADRIIRQGRREAQAKAQREAQAEAQAEAKREAQARVAAGDSPASEQSEPPRPPASSTKKKPPQKADIQTVREKIQGMARDWILETAKQSSNNGNRNARAER